MHMRMGSVTIDVKFTRSEHDSRKYIARAELYTHERDVSIPIRSSAQVAKLRRFRAEDASILDISLPLSLRSRIAVKFSRNAVAIRSNRRASRSGYSGCWIRIGLLFSLTLCVEGGTTGGGGGGGKGPGEKNDTGNPAEMNRDYFYDVSQSSRRERRGRQRVSGGWYEISLDWISIRG